MKRLALLLLLVSACSSARAGDGRVDVQAGFYPLQYLAETIGGDAVRVSSLAKPGAEPHDLELTPQQVGALSKTDLVLLLKGFQPAVDDAVAQEDSPVLDVATVTPLRDRDPHVWLDPSRLAQVARAVTDRLAELAPDDRAGIEQRGAALVTQLEQLDADFRTGLARCERTELVTSHEAFGYLARAYGLQQVGITGLSPDAEPSPGRLAEVARLAREKGVTTVFFEDLVSPKTAESLAREVGAKAVVLSPLESKPEGGDYLTGMRADLAALRDALGCA